MPTRMIDTSGRRRLAITLGIAVAVAMPMATTLAADAPEADAFCESISVDALHELGPLRFAPPDLSGMPGFCSFLASSPEDQYSLAVVTSGISFDLMRQSAPEVVEFTVADHPALMFEGNLHVGLDDGILSVVLDLGGADAVPGLDPVGFATGVAEMVLPAIDATSTGAGGASDAALAPPPEVDGIEWRSSPEVMSAQQLIEADERQSATWEALAGALGADLGDIFILNVNGSDAESREGAGNYSAIRVMGVDGSSLRVGVVDWFSELSGGDVLIEDLTLGGKDVTRLSAGGESRGILYVQGDTAYAISMSDDDTAKVLQALP